MVLVELVLEEVFEVLELDVVLELVLLNVVVLFVLVVVTLVELIVLVLLNVVVLFVLVVVTLVELFVLVLLNVVVLFVLVVVTLVELFVLVLLIVVELFVVDDVLVDVLAQRVHTPPLPPACAVHRSHAAPKPGGFASSAAEHGVHTAAVDGLPPFWQPVDAYSPSTHMAQSRHVASSLARYFSMEQADRRVHSIVGGVSVQPHLTRPPPS